MPKCNLKIDWATHEAAKYACERWHYSGCIPAGKLVKIGVWEDGQFVGVVLFGRGSSPFMAPNKGLKQTECIELVRIALTDHKTPVSRIVKIALIFLKKKTPGIKLVVSFADPDEGHHGGVYQAGNWIYNGESNPTVCYMINGKKTHARSLGAKAGTVSLAAAKKYDPNATKVHCPGKHRYLMPLDEETRVRMEKQRLPYPKK